MNRDPRCSGLLAESLASFLAPHQPDKSHLSKSVGLVLQAFKVQSPLLQSRHKMDEEHIHVWVA